jgi:hypothetical protein
LKDIIYKRRLIMQASPIENGPSLLGLQGALLSTSRGYSIGVMYRKEGKNHVVSYLNPTVSARLTPMLAELPSEGIKRAVGTACAIGSLLLMPVWIPIRAIVSVASSIINIVSGGSLSVAQGLVDKNREGRIKGMMSSLISLVTTPANMLVEGVATASHVINPKLNRMDLLATHMWTGFVGASLPKKTPPSE